MKKVDLDVSWDQPKLVKESSEIVVFRYRLEPFKGLSTTMEEVAEEGELVYRTVDLSKETYMFIDKDRERGEWYYAVFAKNKASLSPGQIDSYLLVDVTLTVNNFDYKTFSPGRVSFDVEVGGADASSWRWKINENEYVDKSIDDKFVDTQIDLPIGEEHKLTVESLNVDRYVSAKREIYFSIYNITVEYVTHPQLPQSNLEFSATQGSIIPLGASELRGHYFIGWELTGFGQINNPNEMSTDFRVFNSDAQIKGVFGLIDYDIKIEFEVDHYPDRNIITGGIGSNDLPYGPIGSLEDNSGVYNIFDFLNLIFNPSSGYEFKSWSIFSGNGTIGDGLSKSTVYRVDNSDTIIKANIQPINYLIFVNGDFSNVDSTGRPMDFNETGTGSYHIDNKFEIVAVPDPGYKFERWEMGTGGGLIEDTSSARTFFTVLPTDATVKAIYSPIDYTVNVADGSNGSAIASKAAFPNNIFQEITITANADPGWELDSWEVSGEGSVDNQNSNPAVFTVGAGDAIITPKYKLVDYDISLLNSSASGSEMILNINGSAVNSPNAKANIGDLITLRAVPNVGFEFDGWVSSDGSSFNNDNAETVFTMPALDVTITANYLGVLYDITVNGGGNGSQNTVGGQYSYLSTVNLIAMPDINYAFSNWVNTGLGSIISSTSASTSFTVGLSADIITANYAFVGRRQSITGTTGYQAFKELEFKWTRSALDGQPINDTGSTTYTYEISKISTFAQLAVPSQVFTTFQNSVLFGDLDAYTRYYCRCIATGDAINSNAVTGTSNTVEFVTNPCGNYSMTRGANNSLQITGAEPNSGVTISEQSGSTQTRGLVRPIADDEFNNLFIAEGSGKVRTQASGPGGRLIFDGGFPKFYNNAWNPYRGGVNNGTVSIYDSSIPAQFPYLYNAINHVEREEGSRKKLLYINDAPGGNYSALVFNNTIHDMARAAGLTPSSIGSNTASSHSGYLQTLHNSRANWATYFSGFDVIVWLGTNYTHGAYLPTATIEGLLDYFDGGGGLFIITDHNIFQTCVNQILPYYGVKFTGDIDRGQNPATLSKYKISTILANSNYIPSGYHPLFANIDPNGSISATRSEGKIIYDNSVANTSNYVTDSSGNLTINNHTNGTPLGGGNTFVRTASDCGGQI